MRVHSSRFMNGMSEKLLSFIKVSVFYPASVLFYFPLNILCSLHSCL